MRATVQHEPLGVAQRLLDRALIGAALFLVMLLIGVQLARATEVIPSVGITRSVNTDDNTAKISGGLALRSELAPFLTGEIGASYRNEDRFGGDLHIKQWPITASLWLKPVPMFYVGGGAGWYHTTLDYDESLALSDETKQKFGVHLGGGMRVPLAPMVGLDLNGRYVFLDDLDQKLSTEKLDPDFWTTSVGLAIKF
jgi:hypothetical protein